ncbi:MAG: hypothetical protein AB7M05_17700 [Alphaproteobacteria bacterium]
MNGSEDSAGRGKSGPSGGSENPGHGGGNPGHGGGDPGHGGGRNEAHIIVDTVPKTVREGEWVVSELKREVGVDAAKVLAEITPSGLVDLDDAANIQVRDGMRFMSHARKGGSS